MRRRTETPAGDRPQLNGRGAFVQLWIGAFITNEVTMIGNVRVMSRTVDTTHIRKLIEKLQERGDRVVGDLIDRARGELLEIEKDRDILVITPLVGHWSVPFTEKTLKDLQVAAAGKWSPDLFKRFVKSRGGQELVDNVYHNCSFYSHVVVQQ